MTRATADTGKQARGKDVLTTAEREKRARLRRRVRRLEQDLGVLAKAMAWFAAKSDETFTLPTNS